MALSQDGKVNLKVYHGKTLLISKPCDSEAAAVTWFDNYQKNDHRKLEYIIVAMVPRI